MNSKAFPDCKFVAKKDSWFMRLIGFFNEPFCKSVWTTIGSTIYYPSCVGELTEKNMFRYLDVIDHEYIHVGQFKKYTLPLFMFLYLFIPLPMFFAYFRWKFEREAYLDDLKRRYESPEWLARDITSIVDFLDSYYFKPWPKTWMREWFEEQTKYLAKQ